MALYRAKAPDGTEIQFPATSLTNAKDIYEERYGKKPLSIGKVIGGEAPTTLPSPEPVPKAEPTTAETWAADYEARYGTAPTPSYYAGLPTHEQYFGPGGIQEQVGELTDVQREDYVKWIQSWKAYMALLRTPEYEGALPKPESFSDFVAHAGEYEEARTKLDTERGYEATREFDTYVKWMNKFWEFGDWRPVSEEDFYANYEQAQQQLQVWQERFTEQEKEIAAVEQYAIDPAEAARRQEEAYQRQQYIQQESFREPARLSETFSQWMNQQGAMSGAFSGFVESKYPSLRGQFEAGMPRPVGYPTREAARTATGRREAGWQAWLPQQVPGLYQEYMGQRPWERGERFATQSPTLRPVNW